MSAEEKCDAREAAEKARLRPLQGAVLMLRRSLTLVVLLALLAVLYTVQIDTAEAIAYLKELMGRWGYLAIGAGCLFESILGVQWIFPGGLMIMLASTQIEPAGTLSFPLVVALATAAALSGYTVDYLLGRAGYVTQGTSTFLTRIFTLSRWPLLLSLACVHPNAAAPLCWLLGHSSIPYLRVLVVVLAAQLGWACLWAVAGRSYGEEFVVWLLDHRHAVSLGLLGIYVVALLLRMYFERRGGTGAGRGARRQ
jgi:membrane protein DedA with SNARE-associated domain